MLERLFIKQFAIIDEMTVEFTSNFTALTGETGAGKSIVIDAVALLLGGRAMSEMIRHGSEKAYVEGVFSLEASGEAGRRLVEEGYGEAEDDCLILSREITSAGKNSCRINGRAVPLSQYKALAAGLIDIHGQHDYQQLMQTPKQLSIADAFGGPALAAKREETKNAFQLWRELREKLEEAKSHQAETLAKMDFLRFQVNEIDEAHLRAGEEEELAAEIQKLSHRERILKNLDKAYTCLLYTSLHSQAADRPAGGLPKPQAVPGAFGLPQAPGKPLRSLRHRTQQHLHRRGHRLCQGPGLKGRVPEGDRGDRRRFHDRRGGLRGAEPGRRLRFGYPGHSQR